MTSAFRLPPGRLRHVAQMATAAILATALLLPGIGQSRNAAPTAAPSDPRTPAGTARKNLSWSSLSPAQRLALQPLEPQWNSIEPIRREKWLTIANQFARMAPHEQERLQERMAEWARLTPQERRLARQIYAGTKRLPPEKKSEQWQQYQQLTEQEKQKLAKEAAARKVITRISPQASRSAQPAKSPVVPDTTGRNKAK